MEPRAKETNAVWLLALVACHGPSETGPGGMVGHVLDASGQPLQGIVVNSVEAEYRTDAEGHFAVAWKPPGTHVFFEREGVYWQRTWLPESDGPEVEIRLPVTRPAKVDCGAVDATCTLRWELGEAFTATATVGCEPGKTHGLAAVPEGAPVSECRRKGTTVETVAADRGDTVALLPPSMPLRVEVRSVEGGAAESCSVRVGEVEATVGSSGFWVAEQAGQQVVRVVCEGRAAWPVVAEPGRGSLVVEWSRGGPEIDLEGRFPEAAVLRLRPLASEAWLDVAPVADGVFPLPPVPAGTYAAAVVVDGAPQDVGAVEPTRGGVLELSPLDGGGAVGVLRLEGDVVSGRIPVHLSEADPD